jgi:hypothetical protein
VKKLLFCGASIAVAVLGTGCVNTAGIVEQLAKDPAAVHLQIRTIYGSIDLARVGGQTNSVQLTSDGITQNK